MALVWTEKTTQFVACLCKLKTWRLTNLTLQFNSKKIFKDGDPVSSQLIFPGAIQTCEQIQQFYIHIYKTTQVHQTNTTLTDSANYMILYNCLLC